MSPILGIWASSSAASRADTGAMFPIGSVVVGSAGVGSVTFSNIPSTYTHLHIRYLARATRNAGASQPAIRFNGDTGNNYVAHYVSSNGSVSAGIDGPSTNQIWGPPITGATGNANTFGTAIVDILDYANTNKYKTVRQIGGVEANGSGFANFNSGLWISTSAITSVTIREGYGNNFVQYSTFVLYGIKGA